MSTVTRHEYWAALDALAKAREIEASKEGEALGAWWRIAEPRWRALEALLLRAEQEDWAGAMVWYALWRSAKAVGRPVGSVDATGPWPVEQGAALAARKAATAPQRGGGDLR